MFVAGDLTKLSTHSVIGYLYGVAFRHLRALSPSRASLLYQFLFEYVTLKDKQAYVGGYNSKRHFMSLLTLVIINVLLMLFWKSLRICFYHMYQIYILGMSLQTCFSVFVHIIKSGGSYSDHYF